MSETIDQKADRYLVEGRVSVSLVNESKGAFYVSGSDDTPYVVNFGGEWTCNCPARVTQCAHIVACQKITHFVPKHTTSFNDKSSDLSKLIEDALKG
jgi:predicted nucleic acid-binding Zn finger protein